MPSFEFGPITTDDGGPADQHVRTIGRIQSDRGVVTMEIFQTVGSEGESPAESAVRWVVGLRLPPASARELASHLYEEADKAEELS